MFTETNKGLDHRKSQVSLISSVAGKGKGTQRQQRPKEFKNSSRNLRLILVPLLLLFPSSVCTWRLSFLSLKTRVYAFHPTSRTFIVPIFQDLSTIKMNQAHHQQQQQEQSQDDDSNNDQISKSKTSTRHIKNSSSTIESSSSSVQFSCKLCSATFSSRNRLFDHLRKDHDYDKKNNRNENTVNTLSPSTNNDIDTSQAAISTTTTISAEERTKASIAIRSQYNNPNHEAYYKQQCNVVDGIMDYEKDWKVAKEYFRKPLPISFRLCTETPATNKTTTETTTKTVIDPRTTYIQHLYSLLEQNNDVDDNNAIVSSPYFDEEFCKVANIPPREWPMSAQKVLSDAQDVGAINRQELCSMIPPILLLHPNKETKAEGAISKPLCVLDLCAAPGSKTLQILDQLTLMHGQRNRQTRENGNLPEQANGEHEEPSTATTAGMSRKRKRTKVGVSIECDDNTSENDDTTTTAMLVANDSNRNRLLTVARRSRLAKANRCTQLILNASDGRHFPALRKWGGYKLKFDRVLADVPCSGDGTLRKLSSQDWNQWQVLHHLQLHKLQVRLLVRALQLVKKGGRVVYSTCSLDPIENEAVVASAIARLGGPSVYRIIPPPKRLHSTAEKDFPYCRGAKSWIVPHPKFSVEQPTVYKSIHDVPRHVRKKDIVPSMFPPRTRLEKDWKFMSDSDDKKDVTNVNNCVASSDGSRTTIVGPTKKDKGTSTTTTSRKVPAVKTKEEELEQLNFFGDIITSDDVRLLEGMLPNCCRILPQHFDSGGFFCATIERTNAEYYAICCPFQRGKVDSTASTTATAVPIMTDMTMDELPQNEDKEVISSYYHGRIFHSTELTAQEELRKAVMEEKSRGEEVWFEGHATLEVAQKWLRQHDAFVTGRSETSIPLSSVNIMTNANANSHRYTNDDSVDDIGKVDDKAQDKNEAIPTEEPNAETDKKWKGQKAPLYTPLFKVPHPDLVAEFCNFFGMYRTQEEADAANVKRFPAENLVVMGGGGGSGSGSRNGKKEMKHRPENDVSNERMSAVPTLTATQITTCQDPQDAHVVAITKTGSTTTKTATIPRNTKRRFFQLVLVSDEIRSIFAGGAKFTPMESGLTICYVPIPGQYYHHCYDDDGDGDGDKISSTKQQQQQEQHNDNDDDTTYVTKESSKMTSKRRNSKKGGNTTGAPNGGTTTAKGRAEKSGRYGLLDQATELIGRCATRRLITLTREETLQLLQTREFVLTTPNVHSTTAATTTTTTTAEKVSSSLSSWWTKWGKYHWQNMFAKQQREAKEDEEKSSSFDESTKTMTTSSTIEKKVDATTTKTNTTELSYCDDGPGAVIVVCPCYVDHDKNNDKNKNVISTLFLSCVLSKIDIPSSSTSNCPATPTSTTTTTTTTTTSEWHVRLLTEPRIAQSWLNLLQNHSEIASTD